MKIAAKEVTICLLWHKPLDYGDIETTWPKELATAWNAFANAIISLRKIHGANVPVYMYLCPVTQPANADIAIQNGIDFSLLPAVQIWAEYPDGTAAKYFLSKNLSERFTGINWKQEDVLPYVKALLYRSKPAETSLICKILPPLCELGGWAWFALAAGTTYKAYNGKNEFSRAAWGTAAFLVWKEFASRGGFMQLQQAAGVGKLTDRTRIKPGGHSLK